MNTGNLIIDKSFELAVASVEKYKALSQNKKEYVLSKQLLKSGTSVGANVSEAVNAESKPDFIHKLGIAQKEAAETIYWIELLYKTYYISISDYQEMKDLAERNLKILKRIISTAKSRRGR